MYRHTKIALVDFSHLDRQYLCQEPKTPNKIHNSRHKRNSFGVARAIKGLLKHAVTVSLKKKGPWIWKRTESGTWENLKRKTIYAIIIISRIKERARRERVSLWRSKVFFSVVDNVIFLRLHSIPRIARTIGLQINMFNLMLLPKLSFLHP